MPTYLSPGVYVEEVDRGSKPIEGVGTAVAAFVGFAAQAPIDDPSDPEGRRPRLVTNWAQFQSIYGGFVEGAMLPHAVFGYFNNGGGSCYIVRVPHGEGHSAKPRRALPSATKRELETLRLSALQEGAAVEVVIEPTAPAEHSESDNPGDKGEQPSRFAITRRKSGSGISAPPRNICAACSTNAPGPEPH